MGIQTKWESANRDGEDDALIRLDAMLSTDQLISKYCQRDWGHHPVFTRETWMRKVAEIDTILGYWSWVRHHLDLAWMEILESQ